MNLKCWWLGHDWAWTYIDDAVNHFSGGNCVRCGEVGDGVIPEEPEYPDKEDSQNLGSGGEMSRSECIDSLFDTYEGLLEKGDYQAVDKLLGRLDAWNLTTVACLSILTATLPARAKLGNRKVFLEQCQESISSKLLVGL